MKNNTLFKNDPIAINENNVLKVTALLYIMDTLFAEKYEDCNELITLAENFGATKDEISAVITEYIKWANGENTYEDAEFGIVLERT